MREIGGFLELELARRPMPDVFRKAEKLNSARNALRWIIKAGNIKALWVPWFTCPVVWQAVADENCKICPYDVDDNFMPLSQEFKQDDFILVNNYFGVCDKNIRTLALKYKNLIVDNAQSFYAKPSGLASFYSPRKFFGLPDGGLAISDTLTLNQTFGVAVSFDLCSHLLKRWDLGPQMAYADFKQNDDALVGRDIQQMSNLTKGLLANVDFDSVKQQRLKNFAYLHNHLKEKNQLKLNLDSDSVPMVYPLKINDAEKIRQNLIANKIFVAKYWPSIDDCDCMKSAKSVELANAILPLPIDQRYNESDMSRILEVLDV